MDKGSANQDGPRSSAPTFQFVTAAGDNIAGDAATRRRVRSHAMADYRRWSTPPKRKQTNSIDLDATPLLDGSVPPSLPLPQQSKNGPSSGLLCKSLSPLTLLDASRSDPFGTFPVDTSHRSRELWDHMYDGTCVMFRTMLDIGFLGIARESIALSQLLSTASRHLEHLRGNDNDRDCHKYTIKATSLLQQRLRHPSVCATDEVVAAVLAFCCDANIRRHPELLNIHMDGLSHILNCRGGIMSLDSSPLLRVMLYWVDINGSYLQDGNPRYAQPFANLEIRSQLSLTFLDQAGQASDDESPTLGVALSQVWYSLQELNEIIQAELSSRELWRDVLFPGFHISPILHALISLPRGTIYDSVDARIGECLRLAKIIYLTELRGKFGIDTIPGELYGSKLRLLLQDGNIIILGTRSRVHLAWALTVGACASCLNQDLRDCFTPLLSRMISLMGLKSFHDFKNMITGFLWSGDALGTSLDLLESRISFEI
ncbi:hypothetical protein BBP40_005056 [Aspergillus hancockii]|nr:hypothetical protein BBP40_005056 [Aspergillus hancockii]